MLINTKSEKDIQIIVEELNKTYTNVQYCEAGKWWTTKIYFSHPRIKHPFVIRFPDTYDASEQFKFEYRGVGIIDFDIEIVHSIVNKQIEKLNKKLIDKNSKKFNKDIFRLYVKGRFAELENVICKDNPKSSSLIFKIKIKRERIDDELKWEYFQKYTICAETSLKNYRADVEYEDVKLVVMDVTNHKECRPTIKEFFELYPNFDDMFNIKEKTK